MDVPTLSTCAVTLMSSYERNPLQASNHNVKRRGHCVSAHTSKAAAAASHTHKTVLAVEASSMYDNDHLKARSRFLVVVS
jgi:hypothetical protein